MVVGVCLSIYDGREDGVVNGSVAVFMVVGVHPSNGSCVRARDGRVAREIS